MKIRRSTFQHVESELFSYQDTCHEIIRLKNDILYGKPKHDENVGGGRSSLPDDPTGQTATLLATHRKLEQMELIVDSISWIINRLPGEKQKMIQLKYWARPQTLTWEGIAKEIPAHRATVIRWRDEIVQAIADRIGWR